MAKETSTNTFVNPLINIQYNLTKDIIKYELPFSLRYVTFSKIAIILWQANVVRINVKRSYQAVNRYASCAFADDRGFEFFEWLKREVQKLETKVLCLPLPQCYTKEIQRMVKKMGKGLLSYLLILYRLNLPMDFASLRLYMISAQFTMHGAIDQFKSALFLLEKANLKPLNKYEVACHFCVKEKIDSCLATNIKLCELQAKDTGRENLLMYFLTFHDTIRDKYFLLWDPTEIYTEVFSINYIFEMSIGNKYDTAVQYIYENFKTHAMNERIKRFVLYALEREASTNIVFYLISHMKNIEDTEMLCKEYGHIILSRMVEEPRWHAYFETAAKYVLSLIQTMSFDSALKCFVICCKENVLGDDRSKIMKKFLNLFKDDIIMTLTTLSVSNCLLLLSVNDIHFLKAIFGLINAQERKAILYAENLGLLKGMEWIVNGRHSFYYGLIRKTFTTKTEIDLYKNYFSGKTGLEMDDFLMIENNSSL